MRPSVLFPLALHLFAVAVIAATVRDVTDLSFDDHLAAAAAADVPVLLEFYALWCSHCRQFAPAYEDVAGFLGQSAHVLRVDGTAQPVLNLRFRVQSYPSFFLVYRHAVYKFTAARSVDNLIHFVQDTDKKSLNYFGGPLSPYWTVVTATLRFVDMLRHQVALFQASGGDLTFLIIAVVIGVLSGLILAIYFITKPSILPPRRPIHPHAE